MDNPLSLVSKFALAVAGGILLLALAFAGFMAFRDHQRAAQITELQNQIALRDKTIEVQQGVYQKLAITSNDLKTLLNKKDVQLQELEAQLKKTGDKLLSANTIIVQLRKDLALHQHVDSGITDPVKPGDIIFVGLDIGSDRDLFHIIGDVHITPRSEVGRYSADFDLKIHQTRPIKFSVVVSQLKDGSWRSSATSSEDDFNVDISLAAVNPYLLDEKWYEKLSLVVEAGIGTNPGLLAGIGVDVEIGKFDIGPRVWAVLDHGASPYFGVSFGWHPFKKVR